MEVVGGNGELVKGYVERGKRGGGGEVVKG